MGGRCCCIRETRVWLGNCLWWCYCMQTDRRCSVGGGLVRENGNNALQNISIINEDKGTEVLGNKENSKGDKGNVLRNPGRGDVRLYCVPCSTKVSATIANVVKLPPAMVGGCRSLQDSIL